MRNLKTLDSIELITNPDQFLNYAQDRIKLYSYEGLILFDESDLTFDLVKSFLQWELNQKLTNLQGLFPDSTGNETFVYTIAPFKPKRTYRQTAVYVLNTFKAKAKQFLTDLKSGQSEAIAIIEVVASFYENPDKAMTALNDAFEGLIIESQNRENFDWEKPSPSSP